MDSSKHVFYFGPDLKPVIKANPGDIIHFKTLDCFSNQISSEEQIVFDVDFSKVNPATGPVYIEGAKRGDALAVKILDIVTSDRGVIVTANGFGVLGDMVSKARTRICEIRDGFVYFRGIKLPYKPMIGVIGVAAEEKIPCGVPGKHGGNLDTKLISVGAKVYLPVFLDGGLLGVGDLHAVMGDGEVCVASCEVPGDVFLKVDVLKNLAPKWPVVEDEDAYYIVVSREKVDDAFYEATNLAVKVLEESLSISWDDAYMLASMIVDMQVSQLVNPVKTVRARIPKDYTSLEKLLRAISLGK